VINLLNLDAERLRRDFYSFVVDAWPLVEFSNVFVDGWHIRAISDYLQSLEAGLIPSNNLMINVPPRHMKSLLVNVFFPAWVWAKGKDKENKKFLCFSYSSDLTIRDSMKCRALIASQWYQERFHVTINNRNDTKDQFENMVGGYRYCFGTGGSIAGQGGDFLLIDDPLEISKANSKAEREHVNFVYDEAISQRGNDPRTVKQVLIMQRLHEDDLCGHLIAKPDVHWETLILPAEYEGPRFQSSIGFEDPRKEQGDLLWPERFGFDEIIKAKSNLSAIGVAGQLQQRPTPLLGAIFKKEWFATRKESMPCVARYFSWDTAASIEDTAAYTCGIVGELAPDYRLFIRNIWRDRIEFPQLQYAIEGQANKFGGRMLRDIIIENKSSGIQAIQSMKQTSKYKDSVMPFNPKGDKIARAYEAAKWCEKGMVILPPPNADNEWMMDFEDELFTFPNSKFKDQVDALSQLCDYLSFYLAEGLTARQRMSRQ
jgi:predicted phage terminase large subunit-like protein